MNIMVALAFDEKAAIRLLNWLAAENARIFRVYDGRAAAKGEPSLPGLYESGVRYEREDEELWSDYLNLLVQGFEDCDALAAARAGELMARGAAALRPRNAEDPVRFPGDGGFAEARALGLRSIPAMVILTTKTRPGRPGLYHCIVKYRVGSQDYYDDPSARLGMLGDPDSPEAREGLSVQDLHGTPDPGTREIMAGGRRLWPLTAGGRLTGDFVDDLGRRFRHRGGVRGAAGLVRFAHPSVRPRGRPEFGGRSAAGRGIIGLRRIE